ncbi:MAG TPA: LacI family DNA-binding transcriptional regulator [Candidatus Goldiibacteriota bacterium]|nr:LacI family DNA-binding transcriptional regulator [Candidatus Goldiibacteriota bacterium]HPN65240.1 LacI family DNA-binding transcriptional regulator [Candidatus Goldiibacteriota bacterium]HRQ44778.1 LacI family DNA-binding transcriptional regulator [Candidatus Goldiibacteriota bacterium]
MKRVTIKDIARELGLAYSTVSMAINDDKEISLKTKQKVKKAIQKMGYVPNQTARSLVKGRTHHISVVTLGLFSLYEMYIVRGIEQRMKNSRYDIILRSARYDWSEAQNEMIKVLHERASDAVIIIGVKLIQEVIDEYEKAKMPLIIIDAGASKKGCYLNIDNHECGRLAAERFIKMGKKKPAVLLGNTEYAFSQSERKKGFLSALSKKGIKSENVLVSESPVYLPEDLKLSGYEGAKKMAKKGADCIYCASGDFTAMGAYKYCVEKGIKIPGEISIIGTDDFDVADALEITTIKQPLIKMGERAFELAENFADICSVENIDEYFAPEIILRKT